MRSSLTIKILLWILNEIWIRILLSLPFTLHIYSIIILNVLIFRTINVIDKILIQNCGHLLDIGPHVLTSSRYSTSVSQKLLMVLVASCFSSAIIVEHSWKCIVSSIYRLASSAPRPCHLSLPVYSVSSENLWWIMILLAALHQLLIAASKSLDWWVDLIKIEMLDHSSSTINSHLTIIVWASSKFIFQNIYVFKIQIFMLSSPTSPCLFISVEIIFNWFIIIATFFIKLIICQITILNSFNLICLVGSIFYRIFFIWRSILLFALILIIFKPHSHQMALALISAKSWILLKRSMILLS